jgi:Zn-dependent M28 family amino/carboxypeptidase
MKRIAVIVWLIGSSSTAWADAPVLITPRKSPDVTRALDSIEAARIEASVRRLVSFGTRHTLSVTDHPDRGIGAARTWLKQQFEEIANESNGRMTVAEDRFTQESGNRIPKPVEIVNLVATLKGTQAASVDRRLVVAAHYDSIPFPFEDAESDAPGANDDASGTAAVLELARVFSKHEWDATIVFLLVAGEEQGLYGSTHWAELAKQADMNIAAMFTNDIIGNSLGGNGVRDASRVRIFSEGVASVESESEARARRSVGGENDAPSRQLARYVKEAGDFYLAPFTVTPVFRRDRFGRGGDHIPFLERGYPAIRFTEPNEDFRRQHQPVGTRDGVEVGDVVERVDFDYLTKVASVNAAALALMAQAPARPSGVRFATRGQSYDTTLAWEPNTEPDLAGYRIVWRETFEPFWTNVVEVGNVSQATIPKLSKDDYFFAVQSFDASGHTSLPSFPGGVRRTPPAAQ